MARGFGGVDEVSASIPLSLLPLRVDNSLVLTSTLPCIVLPVNPYRPLIGQPSSNRPLSLPLSSRRPPAFQGGTTPPDS